MSGPARTGGDRFVPRTAIWIPFVVIGLLVLPMATSRRSFGSDWTLHLWLLRQQQWNIQAMGHPGLFVSARPLGAFYPIFAFVGSGIYSVGGYLAIALGDRPVLAYKLLYVVGLCLAYGGFTWLSVQRGLRGWRSQVAGLIVVTEAYVVTDFAGRGDLGEFMGLASIPFLAAAVYAVCTASRPRLAHRIAVVVGVFVLTGSHNITLLWGSVFVATLGVLTFVGYGWPRRVPVPWPRIRALAGAAAIGAGLNAWYLFPDAAYSLDTSVAHVSRSHLPAVVDRFVFFLDPLRQGYSAPYGNVRMALPWLFLAWALWVTIALWRGRDGASKRLSAGLVVVITGLVALIFVRGLWRWLPAVLYNLQFAWRLGAYVVLGTALLVMLALERHASARGSVTRPAAIALALLLGFNVAAATWQVWSVQSSYVHSNRVVPTNGTFLDQVVASRTVIPPSWRDVSSFRLVNSRFVAVGNARLLQLPLAEIRGSRFSGRVDPPAGRAPFNTDISAGPSLIRMTGIHAVGRAHNGFVVAERAPDVAATGPIVVTIGPADTSLLRAGDLASSLSLVVLAASIVWTVGRRLRLRRREPDAP